MVYIRIQPNTTEAQQSSRCKTCYASVMFDHFLEPTSIFLEPTSLLKARNGSKFPELLCDLRELTKVEGNLPRYQQY